MIYEKQNLLLLFYCFLKESTREEVLVKTIRTANAKFNPVYFHDDINVNRVDFDLMNPLKLEAGSPHQNKQWASDSDTKIPKVSIQKNMNIASLKPINKNSINSDILQSPTSERRACESYESIEKNKDRKWTFFYKNI